MVTGTMPFKGSTVAALKKSILDGRFELPVHLSDDCMDMIKSILKRKASWRLTLSQVNNEIILLPSNQIGIVPTIPRMIYTHSLIYRSKNHDG